MESFIAKKALYGPPRVGGDALSYCTKCKMDLAHVIVSMVENKPAKVICKTCNSAHKYRLSGDMVPRRGASGKTPGTGRVAAPRSVMKIADLWEKRVAESTAKVPQDYSPMGTFLKGDVLQHTKFGMGVIEDVKPGGKIVVLFRDEERVLVHGMQKPKVEPG